MTMTTIHNCGYIQKLCPLGEAHGIVSVLQLGVLGQLTAHQGHLRIHVHEKAIFCVLQEGRHEKCRAWRTNRREENEARPKGGLWGDKVTVPMMDQSEVGRHNHTAGPWILTHGEGCKGAIELTQHVPGALQIRQSGKPYMSGGWIHPDWN